ncbi:MAG TPA: matrixin family metalloprotease [Reyranellaceae bacterium]|nr:matrixin family metalloprotease [Reyranellaceae bacterium]
MRTARLVVTFLISGLFLLLAGIALSIFPANAAPGDRYGAREAPRNYGHAPREYRPYRYTDNRAPNVQSHVIPVFVDRDFNERERDGIDSALREWNTALNGFVEFRPQLLPHNANGQMLMRLRQSAWVIAKVDSSHPAARNGQALQAMAMTVGRPGGGIVYVVSDRFSIRDLHGVMLHELGHVLGAGHDPDGQLMAPVYDRANQCVDRGAVAMVAQAKRLPMQHLNWCIVDNGGHGRPPQRNGRYSSR